MERYRIADDVGIYFVTMSAVKWLPVFVSEGASQFLAGELCFLPRTQRVACQRLCNHANPSPCDSCCGSLTQGKCDVG